MTTRNVRNPGFSLAELVIVIVIISIIAAIAIPRISRGAGGAGEVAVRADLRTLRETILWYCVDHAELPGANGDETTLIDQLTKRTDANGNIGTTAGVHIYGPYLHRFPPLPVGPNIGAIGVIMVDDIPLPVNEGDEEMGWVYNYETGAINANTDDLDASGVGYDTY